MKLWISEILNGIATFVGRFSTLKHDSRCMNASQKKNKNLKIK